MLDDDRGVGPEAGRLNQRLLTQRASPARLFPARRPAMSSTAPVSSRRITQGSSSIAPAPVYASEPALVPEPLAGPTGPVGVPGPFGPTGGFTGGFTGGLTGGFTGGMTGGTYGGGRRDGEAPAADPVGGEVVPLDAGAVERRAVGVERRQLPAGTADELILVGLPGGRGDDGCLVERFRAEGGSAPARSATIRRNAAISGV